MDVVDISNLSFQILISRWAPPSDCSKSSKQTCSSFLNFFAISKNALSDSWRELISIFSKAGLFSTFILFFPSGIFSHPFIGHILFLVLSGVVRVTQNRGCGCNYEKKQLLREKGVFFCHSFSTLPFIHAFSMLRHRTMNFH